MISSVNVSKRPFNIDIFIVEDILIAVRYTSDATDLLVNRLISRENS